MHLPLVIALWTGQREGDVLRLKWCQPRFDYSASA
jgi:hypothetical protein